MSSEDRIPVERANSDFYQALESGEIERMQLVWAHDDWVKCVHPGWAAIVGWQRVRESWERIFQGGQKMRATPTEVLVNIIGGFGWVTCTENITVFNEESFDTAQAAATNLFVQRGGRWLMVLHHASPIPMIVSEDSTERIQ